MVSSLDGMQSAKMVWWCWKAGGQYVRRIVVVPCGARGLQAEGRLFEGAMSHISISVVGQTTKPQVSWYVAALAPSGR